MQPLSIKGRGLRVVPALAVVTLMVAACAPPASGTARFRPNFPAPTGAGLVRPWAALNQVPKVPVTTAQAAALAQATDLVVIKAIDGALVPPMKAANPNVTILVYHNGTFAQKGEETRFPEDWYAHDATGAKLVQPEFGNILMDVSNADWIAHVVQECRDDIATTGADGCYTDMLLTAPLFTNYLSGGAPINRATGKPWTFGDYQMAVDAIADAVSAVTGPNAANGVADGNRWFATGGGSSKPLTDHIDAAHAEIWLRTSQLQPNQFPTVENWKQDLDLVVEAETENRVVLLETKLWGTATTALRDRWRQFTLATYLLGAQGRSTWYLFTSDRTFNGMATAVADPWLHAPVGTPVGGYAQPAGGAYVRAFSTGYVAVNPGSAAVSVRLPAGKWRTLTGQVRSGTVSLAAHTGAVWVKAS
jgi:hypothetical protein